jgi:hypothetical protein
MKLFCLSLAVAFAIMAEQKSRLTVMVAMNSGLPNPQWEITSPDEIEKVKALVHDLPIVPETKWPGLGWSGFILMNENVVGLPEEIRVLNGVIRFENRDGVRYYRDSRGLERWLHREAVARGLIHDAPAPRKPRK